VHPVWFELKGEVEADPWPRVGGDICDPGYQGFTVSYSALQLAVRMGAQNLYLIGMDHNYQLAAGQQAAEVLHNMNVYKTTTEQNYFIPNYHEKGESFFEHRLKENELAYAAAYRHAKSRSLNIVNVTRGGNLEIFPREDLDQVL